VLLEIIAKGLGLEVTYLTGLARSASHRYKIYGIPKRSGGTRTISHPSQELKAAQRWLLNNVVCQLPVHSAATAYRRGRGIALGVVPHLGTRFSLRLDFKDFFPSIRASDIKAHLVTLHAAGRLAPQGSWEDADFEVFCALSCRFGTLPVGAVTSPSLSNSVCFGLDTALAAHCERQAVTYTRYADDLTFSCDTPGVLATVPGAVADLLRTLEYPKGLAINPAKTQYTSKKGRRVVTGLVIGSAGELSVGRKTKRRIRAMIHQWDLLSSPAKRQLAGLLAYAKSIEPDLPNRLVLKYGPDAVLQAMSGTQERATP
jgi:RNA-directed DNA polymerase